MATTNGFDKYVVRISGGNEGRVGLLLCYTGDSFVGRIDFYPDGAAMPQDYLWHPTSTREYVVLEKPLHLYIDVNRGIGASTRGHGHLATTEKEPTGEEEGTP